MDELAARLTAFFASAPVVGCPRRVEQMIADYCASGQDDWRKYCFWNDIHYTRNLVIENDQFELIVLCWNSGQGSRIHNHAQSDCWMGLLDGHLTESSFIPISADGKEICEHTHPIPAPGPCPKLQPSGVLELNKGMVGYASDRLALHAVRTQPTVQSVSLHLYSPPVREVKIFEPETNHVLTRRPGFYSRGGQKA